MTELKFIVSITAIFTLLFSVSLGLNGTELQRECESTWRYNQYKYICEYGTIFPCIRDPPSEKHVCRRTYLCDGVYRWGDSIDTGCAVLCLLMRFSAKLPASQYWRSRLIPNTYVYLERKYQNSTRERKALMHSPAVKSEIYKFFSDIVNLEYARIQYRTGTCPHTSYDHFTQCRVDLRDNEHVRRLCRNETMTLCRRDEHDRVNNHCSRKYRCDGLTPEFGQDGIRKCGLLCWVFEHAFTDFPHGDTPINETTFDFTVHAKYGNTGTQYLKGNFVDLGLEEARMVVFYFFQWPFLERLTFNVTIQVASRNCYLEKPPICRDQDYQNYQVGKVMYPNHLAGCSFPSRLDARYARLVEHGHSTLLPPNECSVFVQCDFTSYFKTHGWRRLDWCRFMDWMFMKSVTWLGLGSKADTSDMQTTISLFNSGRTEADSTYTVTGRGITLPLKLVLAYYDNFTGFTGGYFANHFVINVVFQNCLQETNGSARVEIQGRDYCPHRRYSNPRRPVTVYFCLSRYIEDDQSNSAQCDFYRGHPLVYRCTQVYWIIRTALYWQCHLGADEENLLLNITLRATASNRQTYTRTLSPILRDRAVPYIKNFLVNFFNTLTMFRIDARLAQ